MNNDNDFREVIDDDMEARRTKIDEILSDDDINDEELKKFMEALDIVSTICPDQTKEIKEYSKKLAGQGFTIKSDYLKN